MFDPVIEEIEAGSVIKYNSFNSLLVDASFEAYRLETPALSLNSLDSPFEFVLINAPGLLNRTVDSTTFSEYFCEDRANVMQSIVQFRSLGGDATMIVPSPCAIYETYNHLASFVRGAPMIQIDALWQVVGQLLESEVSDRPLWFNTEGSGVAWLHVRIDTRPRYYGYAEYTVPISRL